MQNSQYFGSAPQQALPNLLGRTDARGEFSHSGSFNVTLENSVLIEGWDWDGIPRMFLLGMSEKTRPWKEDFPLVWGNSGRGFPLIPRSIPVESGKDFQALPMLQSALWNGLVQPNYSPCIRKIHEGAGIAPLGELPTEHFDLF